MITGTACPVFDRLLGSRLTVINLEVRLPLIGNDQFGLLRVPFLPTEIAPFVDAGVAWSKGDDVNRSSGRTRAGTSASRSTPAGRGAAVMSG